jgi:hypothetical protein
MAAPEEIPAPLSFAERDRARCRGCWTSGRPYAGSLADAACAADLKIDSSDLPLAA